MPDADVPNDPSPSEAAASEAERWATRLPAPAEAFLRTQNPWWRGEADAPAILTVGDLRIPVEVKYRQRIDARRDLRGLLSYIDRDVNLAPFGLLVTLRDDVEPMDPRVVSLPLASLLLLR
jgi:hypothetical protein